MALSRSKVWGTEVLTAADLNAEFDNILSNAASLISPLGGALDWDGYAHTLDAAGVTTAQSTASIGWSFTPGNKTGTPSTTGGIANYAASTWTDNNTAGSGTATAWVGHAFQRPTLAASNSSVTTTTAATVYIANAPLAGSNQTLTKPWALWVDAGDVRLDGNIQWFSDTSFSGRFDHANSSDHTYTFPNADGDIPTVASQAEVNAMTSTTTAISPNANKIVIETAQATTSGTSFEFTGIPSGVRRVVLTLSSVSLSGTDDILVQIGPSGGVDTSGYDSTATRQTSAPGIAITSSTSGFVIKSDSATYSISGAMVIEYHNPTTDRWSCYGTYSVATTTTGYSGGSVALSGVLSRIKVLTTGANTFDSGSINISYER